MSETIGEALIVIGADARNFARDVGNATQPVMKRLGRTLSDALATPLKVGAAATGAAVAGILTTTINKGFNRLVAIDSAQARMRGLGYTTAEVGQIMDSVSESVTGTAFGLDEAATAAALMLTSGVEMGEGLDAALAGIVGTAAAAGTSLSDIGGIWQKVAAQNRLSTEQLNQLTERGVNGLAALADHYGITQEAAREMVTAGEVDFENFNAAMTANMGEMAASMGESFEGLRSNVVAGFGRLGAAVLEPVVEGMKPVMGAIVDQMREVTPAVQEALEPLSPRITAFFENMAEAILAIDVPGLFDSMGDAVDRFGGLLAPLSGLALGAFGPFLADLPVVGRLFSGLTGPVGLVIGLLVTMWRESTALQDAVGVLFAALSEGAGALGPLFEVLGDLVTVLAGTLGDMLANAIVTILPIAEQLLEVMGPVLVAALEGVVGMIERLSPLLITLSPVIVGLVAAFKAYSAIMATVTAVKAGYAAASYGAAGATYAQGAAAKAGAVAQRVLNAAMRANPIGLVITAITALVGALVWFFTKTETGKRIIQAVWGAIQSAIGAVVDWFQNTVLPILQSVWDAIVSGFEWVKGAVSAVGDALQAAWQAVGDAFGWVYDTLVQPAIDGFLAAVGWLRDNVLPIFKAIGDGFAAVGKFIWDVYSNVIGLAFDLVAFAATWLWENALRPVFNAIKTGFSAVASWFSDRADDIAALWDAMVAALQTAWAWLDANVFQVFRRVIASLRDWVNARVMDIRRIWEGIKSAFRAVWDWIDRNVFSVFRTGIDNLKTNIGLAVDGAKAAWDTLKASFRAVWDWIKSNVFDRFTGGLDTLKGWVEDSVDRIGRLWRGVANLMREPINWVINTVWNNGLKAAFDNVARAINSDKRLPAAPTIPRFATGGLARRGWAIVGEEGPELVNFTAPGRVYTAEQTRRMLAGPSNPLTGQWSENDPPHGGVGQWFSDRWSDIKRGASAVGGVIRDAAGNVIEWARGGLAELADIILTPIFNTVSRTVGRWGDMGRLGGDAITNVKDRMVEWIRGKDEEANVPQDPGGRSLRGARPYVNAAAFALADMVGGIRTMQAFNQSMAGGHPRGLAVDFIDSVSKLNALANAIIRVGGFDRFNYMAWQGRLWSPGRGWRPQGRGFGNDPFHRWHLHAEWFDKGGLLKKGWNVVYNGTGSDEQVANITGLVERLRRGALDVKVPEVAQRHSDSLLQRMRDGRVTLSKDDMDYLADRLAEKLWPMARAADHVNDFASMGRTRLRMGGV